MIIMEAPLYYDAIEMGLLDKDNPAEDFYENKHLNSDLICCNFTELSDQEFYDSLSWANKTLMKNYFNKQKKSTLDQIDYLYSAKDVTFRGFRHSGVSGQVGEQFNKKLTKNNNINGIKNNGKKDSSKNSIKNTGNQVLEGITNWEGSSTEDGERFSNSTKTQDEKNKDQNKEKCFVSYLEKKTIRTIERKKAKASSMKKKKAIILENSSQYTNWH